MLRKLFFYSLLVLSVRPSGAVAALYERRGDEGERSAVTDRRYSSMTFAPIESQPLPAPEQTMDLPGYITELDRWAATSRRLKDHPQEAAKLRKALPKEWSVEVDGQLYVVPTDWLGLSLESVEKDFESAADYSEKIRSRLEAVRAEVIALSQPSASPDLKEARAKLEEILKRREFRSAREPSWLTQYRRRLGAWILEVMEKLFGRLQVPPKVTQTLGWGLAIGLSLIFLVWLIRQFLRHPIGRPLKLPEAVSQEKRWRDWAHQAMAAAARGQNREAIRLAYWAGVYHLEESGVWQVERARTPREYLLLLPAGHPSLDSLSTVTSRFERIWYGGQMASTDDFQFTVTRLEELGCAFPSNPVTGNS